MALQTEYSSLFSLSFSFQFLFAVLSLHFLLLVLSYVTFSSTQLLNRTEAFRCEGQSEVWIGSLWRIISRDTRQPERRNEHTYTQAWPMRSRCRLMTVLTLSSDPSGPFLSLEWEHERSILGNIISATSASRLLNITSSFETPLERRLLL